jgi:hypothetical protein
MPSKSCWLEASDGPRQQQLLRSRSRVPFEWGASGHVVELESYRTYAKGRQRRTVDDEGYLFVPPQENFLASRFYKVVNHNVPIPDAFRGKKGIS